MPLSSSEINKRFGKHPAAIEGPNPNEPAHALLREAYVSFVDLINQLLPDSRDTSLSLTALEESSMWAHKAVGRQEYQVVDLGGPPTFQQELVNLINKHSLEHMMADTADWVLGEFIQSALSDLCRAFIDVDAGLNYAVVHYAERSIKTLDLAVRLRAGQSEVRTDNEYQAEKMTEEQVRENLGISVPLVDRTGETPQVVGEAQVVEKADGFHIEGVLPETPGGLAPTSVQYSLSEEPKPGVDGLLEHFGLDASRYPLPGNES